MKRYALIINNETKEVSVCPENQINHFKECGYTEMNVEQSWNGQWYVQGYAPEKPAPTKEEISELRKEYRRANIDDKTAERSRKMANGTWTEQDEQDYLALDAQVTAYIEEHFPYPVEE